ncbi:response regulator transcription factor [Nitrosomonas aestuarii]|uniref:response regulator transcription factor n=1 Tax=Nitrosomonas aestuarii TaxID=52441 RepID=UPI000D2FFFDF|nr:helix-turn-helix transcriptional regulator [Nitrosomonas aestuarii]PTN10961.1 DNA-binding NarL/FixJ family response regulator [Nitrosomonas aestuarii]
MDNEIALKVLSGSDHQKTLAIINWLNNCRTKTEFNLILKEALLPLMTSNSVFYGRLTNGRNNAQLLGSVNISNCCQHNWNRLMHCTAQNPAAAQFAVKCSDTAISLDDKRRRYDNTLSIRQPAHKSCTTLSLQADQNRIYQFHFCRQSTLEQAFNQRDSEILKAFKSPLLQTLKLILFHEESLNSHQFMEFWSEHTEPVAVICNDGSTLYQSPTFMQMLKQEKIVVISTVLALIKTLQRKQLEWHSFLSKLGKRLYEIKLTLLNSDTNHQPYSYLIQLSRVTHTIGKIFNQLSRKGLTHRELEIALLIYQGIPTREIAETIHLSYHTVRNHIKNIYSKLEVSSRSEMLLWVG